MAGIELTSAYGAIHLSVEGIRQAAAQARVSASEINIALDGSGRVVGEASERIAASMARVAQQIALQEQSYKLLQRDLDSTAAKYGENSIQAERKQIALNRLSDSIQHNRVRLADLSNQLSDTGRKFIDLSEIYRGIEQGIGQGLVDAFMSLGAVIGSMAQEMIGSNAQFEQYRIQFGVLLGSADAAQQRMEELAEFGAKTPFELPGVVEADRVLQAFGLHSEEAAQRFGYSGAQIRTIAGDVAAGTGASMQEIANALGKFSAGQVGEAMQRLSELGAVTRDQLRQMGIEFNKSGELTSPLSEAMSAALSVMEGTYGGMMDAQSRSFSGMLSNLNDWKGQMLRTLGEPTFTVLEDQLDDLLVALNQPGLKNAIAAIGEALGAMASGAVGTLQAVIDGIALIGNGFDLAKTASDRWLAASDSYGAATDALNAYGTASESTQATVNAQAIALQQLQIAQAADVETLARMATNGEQGSIAYAHLQAAIQDRSRALDDGAASITQAIDQAEEHARAIAGEGEAATLTGEQIQEYSQASKSAAAEGQKVLSEIQESDQAFRDAQQESRLSFVGMMTEIERGYYADLQAAAAENLAAQESLMAAYAERVAQSEQDAADAREAIVAESQTRIEDIQRGGARSLEDARNQHGQRINDTEDEARQRLSDAELAHQRRVADLQNDLATAATEAKKISIQQQIDEENLGYQRKQDDLKVALDRERAEIEQDYARQQEAIQIKIARDLEDQRIAAERKRQAAAEAAATRLQDLQIEHIEERASQAQQYRDELSGLAASHTQKVAQENQTFAAKEAKAVAQYQLERAEQQAHLGQMLLDYATAQGRLNGVSDLSLQLMTARMRQEYGIQEDLTRQTFGRMTDSINGWASAASRSSGGNAPAPPGRADGGVVSGGGMYEVVEGGRPELLAVDGHTYLLMGQQSGEIIPASDTARAMASAVGAAPMIGAGGATTTNTTHAPTTIGPITIITGASPSAAANEIGMLRTLYGDNG